MKNKILISIGIMLTLSACSPNEPISSKEQAIKDDKIIRNYFTKHNITDAIEHPSGVYIQHVNKGIGDSPKLTDNVTVKYELYSLPSDKRKPQTEDPITFKLQKLITGWQIGIPYIQRGGSAYL